MNVTASFSEHYRIRIGGCKEPAESPVLIFLLSGQHAQLERFDGHRIQDTKFPADLEAADLGNLGFSRPQNHRLKRRIAGR
jgi:hypothetical protein